MTAQPVDLISLRDKVESGFSGIEQILSEYLNILSKKYQKRYQKYGIFNAQFNICFILFN